MPNYKTHLTFGFVIGIIFIVAGLYFKAQEIPFFIIGFFICLVYSLLPDIDHPGAWIRRLTTYAVLAAIFCFALVKNTNYILILSGSSLFIFIVAEITGHRGWFHSVTAAIVFSLPLIFFTDTVKIPLIPVSGFLSYLSHIVADKFIKEGDQ